MAEQEQPQDHQNCIPPEAINALPNGQQLSDAAQAALDTARQQGIELSPAVIEAMQRYGQSPYVADPANLPAPTCPNHTTPSQGTSYDR